MKRALILFSSFAIATLVSLWLSGYGFLSVKAKRLLSFPEASKFTAIIWRATVELPFHTNRSEGLRLLSAIGDMLSDQAQSEAVIRTGSRQASLVLPPYSILSNCERILATVAQSAVSNPTGFHYPPESCQPGVDQPSTFRVFLSIGTWQEFEHYFNVKLPQSGWRLVCQIKWTNIYEKDGFYVSAYITPYFSDEVQQLVFTPTSKPRFPTCYNR
jgi:hypothetical protein